MATPPLAKVKALKKLHGVVAEAAQDDAEVASLNVDSVSGSAAYTLRSDHHSQFIGPVST